MVDLTNLCGESYKLLEFLELHENFINDRVIIKSSQDEMAFALSLSKHKVNSSIKKLIAYDYIKAIDTKGKYQITKQGYHALQVIGEGKRKSKASQYTCASFFAGVGGIDLGFDSIGFKTIYANELDVKAAHTYEMNSNIKVDCRDIHDVVNDLKDDRDPFEGKKFNILLAGFPCQAFSIAGHREGFADKKGRGGLFFEVMKIIQKIKPEVVFLENVKNLLSHDNKKTYRIISDALISEGYHIKEKVLNSMVYGNLPQNRERIYIVAFRNKDKWDKFRFPFPIDLEKKLDLVIDFKNKVNEKFYYTKKFPHYDEIKDVIIRQDTVYQWRRVYVRENKNNVCPTLTANMGTGGHNVPLISTDFGIRKLTPAECFSLQGFPDSYKLPSDVAISHLYKQAGNSVSVSVIKRIAKEILKVL